MTNQPKWKLLQNLGDVNPIDYGGYFVYIDETGVYPPEAEILQSPDSDDSPEGWTVYRFPLDRCTLTNGILSDNRFHPEIFAWFANLDHKGTNYTILGDIASFGGQTAEELIADICSDDPIRRAHVYRLIGEYHGFDNLDAYPLHFATREEVEKRYPEEGA